MGFDVTFHPVSIADLHRFVFDVAADPDLAPGRAKEITKDRRKQKDLLEGVLSRLPDFVQDVRRDGGFNQCIAFAAAAVAGYRHPYWYARDAALSFLASKHAELRRLFTPLPAVAKGTIADLDDDSKGLLTESYTASGVVLPENIAALMAVLRKLAKPAKGKKTAPLFEVFDETAYDSLARAIAYAADHELGLMEATDLVVPITSEGFTDADNLRAHFLDNQGYAAAGPPKPKKAAKKSAPKKSTRR